LPERGNALKTNSTSQPVALCVFSLVCSLGLAQGIEVQKADTEETNPYTISLEVDQVVLDVTVQDHDGGFVSGLEKSNFQVYEDGRPQAIEFFHHGDVPVTVGLVIDNSGSMRSKRSQVVIAALAFVQGSYPQDETFVVNFNEKASFGLHSGGEFTNSISQLRNALIQTACAGQTALYDALSVGLQHLKNGHHEKKVLLVISDGGDNASRHKFQDVLTMAQQSNATIYTIGLYDPENKDQNPKVLKRLAKISGGECFLPSSVSDITNICERIAKDIRNQYTIAYTPSNTARDGRYRTIKVAVKAPHHDKLIVRTREGYFAPSATTPSHKESPRSIEDVTSEEGTP
jgi:Ca-activated chloride channel homolog